MSNRYLEITYRRGKPIAAYLYLPRRENDSSQRVCEEGPGLLVDLAADGRPIGVEILLPQAVTLSDLNAIFAKYALAPLDRQELAPLEAVA